MRPSHFLARDFHGEVADRSRTRGFRVTADAERGVEHYAVAITASWQRAVSSILDAGSKLLESKETMPHGEFGRLIGKLGNNIVDNSRLRPYPGASRVARRRPLS